MLHARTASILALVLAAAVALATPGRSLAQEASPGECWDEYVDEIRAYLDVTFPIPIDLRLESASDSLVACLRRHAVWADRTRESCRRDFLRGAMRCAAAICADGPGCVGGQGTDARWITLQECVGAAGDVRRICGEGVGGPAQSRPVRTLEVVASSSIAPLDESFEITIRASDVTLPVAVSVVVHDRSREGELHEIRCQTLAPIAKGEGVYTVKVPDYLGLYNFSLNPIVVVEQVDAGGDAVAWDAAGLRVSWKAAHDLNGDCVVDFEDVRFAHDLYVGGAWDWFKALAMLGY